MTSGVGADEPRTSMVVMNRDELLDAIKSMLETQEELLSKVMQQWSEVNID